MSLRLETTEVFDDWLEGLRDRTARTIIARRVRRLETGHPGDVRPVGDGVSEMRVHHGPGYRLYFKRRGDVVIVLLCGGDKSSQARDIARALEMAKDV